MYSSSTYVFLNACEMNYLNEEFVALEVTEPGDPPGARLLTVIIIPSASSRIEVVLGLLRTIHLQSIRIKLLIY